MTQERLRRGQLGEELVAARLTAAGWRLLARNARTRAGELDIVGLDAGTLVFVEVKTGTTGASFGPTRPVLAVGPAKQLRLRRLGAAWLAAQRAEGRRLPRFREIRFDVIGVTLGPGGEPAEYEHLRAAF